MSLPLRIVISAALLGLLAWRVDWGNACAVVARSHWQWLAVAFLVAAATLCTRASALPISLSGWGVREA